MPSLYCSFIVNSEKTVGLPPGAFTENHFCLSVGLFVTVCHFEVVMVMSGTGFLAQIMSGVVN